MIFCDYFRLFRFENLEPQEPIIRAFEVESHRSLHAPNSCTLATPIILMAWQLHTIASFLVHKAGKVKEMLKNQNVQINKK